MNVKRVLAVVVLAVASAAVAAPLRRGEPDPDVSAPVAYKDLMLVLVTKDGAAAVVFGDVADEGNAVEYRFRFESADGKKKLSGTGKLFEKRTAQGDFDPEGVTLTAGPIHVKWSRGGTERGWIYYAPEMVTVHLANASNFEGKPAQFRDSVVQPELELGRFIRK